jgi:hypothetical protein
MASEPKAADRAPGPWFEAVWQDRQMGLQRERYERFWDARTRVMQESIRGAVSAHVVHIPTDEVVFTCLFLLRRRATGLGRWYSLDCPGPRPPHPGCLPDAARRGAALVAAGALTEGRARGVRPAPGQHTNGRANTFLYPRCTVPGPGP